MACTVESVLVKHRGHEATIGMHIVLKLGILNLYLFSTYIFLHATVLSEDQSPALSGPCTAIKTNYIHV